MVDSNDTSDDNNNVNSYHHFTYANSIVNIYDNIIVNNTSDGDGDCT